MKMTGGSTDGEMPRPRRDLDSYLKRRDGLNFISELPANTECYLEVDEKRDCVIVRRKSDQQIVMVVKGDRIILKAV